MRSVSSHILNQTISSRRPLSWSLQSRTLELKNSASMKSSKWFIQFSHPVHMITSLCLNGISLESPKSFPRSPPSVDIIQQFFPSYVDQSWLRFRQALSGELVGQKVGMCSTCRWLFWGQFCYLVCCGAFIASLPSGQKVTKVQHGCCV